MNRRLISFILASIMGISVLSPEVVSGASFLEETDLTAENINIEESSSTGEEAADPNSGKWVQDEKGWWYWYRKGGYPKNELKEIDGYLYSFDKNGYIETGWKQLDNGDWLYLHLKGGNAMKGWQKINGRWYAFGDDYIMLTGMQDFLGYTYILYKDGRMLTGWQDYNGKTYYCHLTGGNIMHGWQRINGKSYFFEKDGHLIRNTIREGGYIDNTGAWKAGGLEKDPAGTRLVFADGTYIENKVIKIDDKSYYFGKDGYRQQGMIKAGSDIYFTNKDASLKINQRVFYKDNFYYTDGSGKVIKGKRNHGGISDKNGIWTITGWVEEGGKKMYCKENVGIIKNDFVWDNYERYYLDGEGLVKKGWFTVNGNKYYGDNNGCLAIGPTVLDKTTCLFDGNGKFTGTKEIGIDVSAFNNKIDWKKVKAAGVDYAFVRVGGRFGGSGKLFEDGRYKYNLEEAQKNGIKLGVYFYTQAITEKEAVEEAKYICERIKDYNITLPVAYDTEYVKDCRHNNLTKEQRTKVAKAFCDEVKAQGYEPMIYSNLSWLNKKLDMTKLEEYKTWVAQYYYKCDYGLPYSFWQYTSDGKIDGINGRVDLNLWYE